MATKKKSSINYVGVPEENIPVTTKTPVLNYSNLGFYGDYDGVSNPTVELFRTTGAVTKRIVLKKIYWTYVSMGNPAGVLLFRIYFKGNVINAVLLAGGGTYSGFMDFDGGYPVIVDKDEVLTIGIITIVSSGTEQCQFLYGMVGTEIDS